MPGRLFCNWESRYWSPQDETLIPFVAPAVKVSGRLGIGARHDDSRDLHDVELQTGGVEPFDLLVHLDQHLAGLVTAFFYAGFLILDMITGNTGFNESGGSDCARVHRRHGLCRHRR